MAKTANPKPAKTPTTPTSPTKIKTTAKTCPKNRQLKKTPITPPKTQIKETMNQAYTTQDKDTGNHEQSQETLLKDSQGRPYTKRLQTPTEYMFHHPLMVRTRRTRASLKKPVPRRKLDFINQIILGKDFTRKHKIIRHKILFSG